MAESTRKLHVAVIGDLFRERYYVPIPVDGPDSPITYPEALRGKNAVRAITINSGASLHCEIINEFFSPSEEDGKKHEASEHISVIRFQGPDSKSWNAFHTYLHELGSFPRNEPITENQKKVWRIANTQGLVEHVEDVSVETIRAKNRRIANSLLGKQIERTRIKIKNILKKKDQSLVLIVNDRNHGFRECEKELSSLITTLETHKPEQDILIIWHVHTPHFSPKGTTTFADKLRRSLLKYHTIVVINQQCLRDQGVNVRFDVSYEHTFSDLIDFADNQLLHSLLGFPQVLVRFDYGVLHICTDTNRPREAVDAIWQLQSVDVHGMIGGPFYISHKKFGMTTGRTFLLVLSLLSEISRWFSSDPKVVLADVFRMEGISKCFNGLEQRSEMQWVHPMADIKEPSILRSTVIDQGIDCGILLNAQHFYKGFNDFQPGTPPFENQKEVTEHYASLFKDWRDRLEHKDDCTPYTDGKVTKIPTIWFDHEEPNLTRLSRLSMCHKQLSPDSRDARNRFSRVIALDKLAILKLVDPEFQKTENLFDEVLYRLVRLGAEGVLCRPVGEVFRKKVCEPSSVVPFVRHGSKLISLDRDEIDGLLSIRFLIENYLARPQFSREPLSIAVFGPPGAGKSFFVGEILRSLGKNRSSETMTFNLSQFPSVDRLAHAFRRIQDSALAGEIPVAFFDEFDSRLKEEPLGWLRYFLSPMHGKNYASVTKSTLANRVAPLSIANRIHQRKQPEFLLPRHYVVYDETRAPTCPLTGIGTN